MSSLAFERIADGEMSEDYLRRLLVSRDSIRSALLNPGGSIILSNIADGMERGSSYSSAIGNDFHLDLIEAESIVAQLPKGQRDAVVSWVMGLTTQQAAEWFGARPVTLRKRRQRGIEAAVRGLNEGARGDGGLAAGRGSGPRRDDPAEAGGHEQAERGVHPAQGDTPEPV